MSLCLSNQFQYLFAYFCIYQLKNCKQKKNNKSEIKINKINQKYSNKIKRKNRLNSNK